MTKLTDKIPRRNSSLGDDDYAEASLPPSALPLDVLYQLAVELLAFRKNEIKRFEGELEALAIAAALEGRGRTGWIQ